MVILRNLSNGLKTLVIALGLMLCHFFLMVDLAIAAPNDVTQMDNLPAKQPLQTVFLHIGTIEIISSI